MEPLRVAVFLDWQNVYRRARDSFGFGPYDPAYCGQVFPLRLAQRLTDKHSEHAGAPCVLVAVHIYRGRPVAEHDARGSAAFRRQDATWRTSALVHAHYRDLRYPRDWGEPECIDKPREKGVDVELAVDIATRSSRDEYDVAVVMSADYDLVPALKYALERREAGTGPDVVVAAWKGDQDGERPLRLHVPGQRLWCHWLEWSDYDAIKDERDYGRPAPTAADGRPRPRPPGS